VGGLSDQPFLMMYELSCIQEGLDNYRRQQQAFAEAVTAAESAMQTATQSRQSVI
jgi:hypothetical protein